MKVTARHATISTVLASAVLGCSSGANPAEPGPGAIDREWRNLAYASGSAAQKLDLYLPTTGAGPFPLVIWVHGGGWQNGDKALGASSPALALRARGFAVASLNYRLSDEAIFPAQIFDVKTAVRFLRANSSQYRLDPQRFGAWGSSAGGHLVALLGTSAGVPELEGAALGNASQSSRVMAVVDWFGPADFINFEADGAAAGCPQVNGLGAVAGLLGGPVASRTELARQASPTTYVSADDPPFLIQHGTADCTVPWPQSNRLYNQLTAVLAPNMVSYTSFTAGHGGPEFATVANVGRIQEFFETHLR